jgi:diguanylate cyclase (GGDEF)-like protein
VLCATDGDEALRLAREEKPDLALLDIMMPGKDGLEVCRELRAEETTRNLPIVFVSAKNAPRDRAAGLRAGAVDYIAKPFHPEELVARVRTQLTLKQLQDRLRRMARTDALTGLYNRGYFETRLAYEYRRRTRYGRPFTCLVIDIDHFKRVNDTRGHRFGDLVLKDVGRILLESFRSVDTVARYGGEEFVVLLPETDLAGAALAAARMADRVREHPFTDGTFTQAVTLSGGIVHSSDPRVGSAEDVVKLADRALYAAKDAGRNRIYVWHGETLREARESPGGSA